VAYLEDMNILEDVGDGKIILNLVSEKKFF
jgi:hypothetical protein